MIVFRSYFLLAYLVFYLSFPILIFTSKSINLIFFKLLVGRNINDRRRCFCLFFLLLLFLLNSLSEFKIIIVDKFFWGVFLEPSIQILFIFIFRRLALHYENSAQALEDNLKVNARAETIKDSQKLFSKGQFCNSYGEEILNSILYYFRVFLFFLYGHLGDYFEVLNQKN